MKYSIVKFGGEYGYSYYQVRLRKGIWRPWLKDGSGAVLTFPLKEDAHQYMHRVTEKNGVEECSDSRAKAA